MLTRRIHPAQQSTAIKYYLVLYNLASALGWAYILITLLAHLRAAPASPAAVAHYASLLPASINLFNPNLTPTLAQILARASTTHAHIGRATAAVQTCAALEVAHALLGWVRSPLGTVAMQVASRYYAVYGINLLFPAVRVPPSSPFLARPLRAR